jgi:hypothetical protein
MPTIDEILTLPPYSLDRGEKEAALLPMLNALTEGHRTRCPAYSRLLEVFGRPGPARRPSEVPFLPVGLFKSHRLVSVPDAEIFKTLTSSGTTGQQPSQIFLDRVTAQRQTAALVRIMTHLLGPRRLPMLLVESRDLIKNRSAFSARGAGVLGMMSFGRDHLHVLGEDDALDVAALKDFLQKHGRAPFLIFGFTFMVWQYLFKRIEGLGLDLSNGILVHSGGWKKLREEEVDNATFQRRLAEATGLKRVYSFYGMVEQVGSVFLEGEDGHLYAPNFADVVVRDPETWEEQPHGRPGVIQVLSALPESYPGHSILTEDLGVVHGEDDGSCGRRGKHFSVLGRVPRTELRGCSDTHAYDRPAAS